MKNFIIMAVGTILLASCSNSKNDSYTITGEIKGLPDSSVVMLTPLTHQPTEPLAEAVVVDGKFEFNGVAEEPMAVVLTVKEQYGGKRLMLENARIEISGTANSSTAYDGKTSFDFNNVTVTGSPMTDRYNEIMAPRLRLDSLFIANQNNNSDLVEMLQNARQNKNQAAIDSITSSQRYQIMTETESKLFHDFDSVFIATVKNHSNDFWGPLMMIAQVSYLTADQRDMYESLSDEAKNSYYGRLVFNELYPVGRPGDKMPEFTATTTDGRQVSLADVCKDKKYVLLDFWASWCGPCRREIPNLKEIYKKYHDHGFEILSVSIDREEEPWIKAVNDEQLKWTNIRDTDHSIADQYKVSAVPTMYLIDSNGCLVAENLRGEQLAEKINELMTE